MHVLVTGASGFVGSHAVRALVAEGHQVRGLSRKHPSADRHVPGADYVDGVDVGDASTLTGSMFEGIDAVLHLVGIIQEGPHGQTFQRIHVDGTRNVVAAATDAGLPGRFIYMSAIGASAHSKSEYSRTKDAAEQIVSNSGLPYTIFRPSLVLGADGEFVAQMQDLVRHGGLPLPMPFPFIPVPGPGFNKFQPIWVDDLLACVLGALRNPATANQTFEVGGASQVTFNELIGGFAESLHVRKPVLHAPIPILRIAAAAMETVMPKPPVTRDQLANLAVDNITSSHAISDVFGVTPLSYSEMQAKLFA